MGTYEGRWKHVDDETFFVVVKNGMLYRKVMLRDGRYEHTNDTLASSSVSRFSNMSLEKQAMELIDEHLSEVRSTERQIDNAFKKIDEVYGGDW